MKFPKLLSALALTAATTLAASSANAETPSSPIGVVSNIKIVSDKSEDVTSLDAWKKTYIKDGMSDEEKALAIWKSVVKYRHQENPPDEFVGSSANVHDPIKTFNVYGYGQCCCASSNIEGLARYLGMPAQGRSITAHSVPEVWYDGQWHLLDASLMSFFRNAAGKVASVDEIHQSIKDWRKENPGKLNTESEAKEFGKNEGWKKGPAVLATVNTYNKDGINGAGWHGWWSNVFEYGKLPDKGVGIAPDGSKSISVFDYGPSMGYQVNVQLRDGEKITRNWSHKGLHVNMHDKRISDEKVVVDFSVQNKGPDILRDVSVLKTQREMGDVNPGRVGNGTHEWDVPLASANLKLAALTHENLQNKAEGATAANLTVKDAAQPGTLVIRMPSSYVYLSGEVTLNAVVGNGGSVAVLFSDNHGMDWKELSKSDKPGELKIDIKQNVFRKYDYQLKVVMNGAGTGLNTLKLTHDIQHSQIALPVITSGDNKINFSAGPQEGTITYEGNVVETKTEKNLSYLAFHPVLNGITPERMQVGETGKGDATFTFKTPGDITRLRINAHYRARDMSGKDYWDVECSFDKGQTWKKIDRLDKGQPASSKYMVFTDVPAGSREAQVRFSGKQSNTTCIFDLRMDADYKEPAGGFKPVKITYVWDENGTEKKLAHIARTPNETFNIKCGDKTVAKSYTLELAK
jgi:hypothetical protein